MQYRKGSRKVDSETEVTECLARIVGRADRAHGGMVHRQHATSNIAPTRRSEFRENRSLCVPARRPTSGTGQRACPDFSLAL